MGNVSQAAQISVVIPAFNAEQFLGRALRSIARQTLAPVEIIVVDDASSDRTREIAAEHGATVIAFASNAGPSAARNAGCRAATAPWVAFLDADDVWCDDKLEAQWAALCAWPDAGLCFTDYEARYANGAIVHAETTTSPGYALVRARERRGAASLLERSSLLEGLVHTMFIRQSSVVVRREAFFQCGGFDERLRLAEDYDFFLRLIGITATVAVERPLTVYQRREASASADPVAEIISIDALWTEIGRRPERYPPGVAALVRGHRQATLRKGALSALRLGRFADADTFIKRVFEYDRSPATLALFVLVRLADTPPGRSLFPIVRAAWRRLRGHPQHSAISVKAS